jgi:8-oxo-dGTP pyrophosphatase MutT (NUDIX family)
VCLVSDGRHWGLPKGIVEQGESPEQAALREIAEETGLAQAQLQIVGSLPSSEYVYRSKQGRLVFKRVHHFLVLAPSGALLDPDPAEISDAAWLDFAVAAERAAFKDTKVALDAARALLDSVAARPPT